jgi:DNA-binding transcriptional ArsR family regulator
MRANKRSGKVLRLRRHPDLCNVPCFKENLVARLQNAMPEDEEVEEIRVLFGLLADRTRLRILYALKSGEELCVCDVAHVLGMSVSATSHHLRKLRDLKVLKYRNDGRMAYYSLKNRFAAELVTRSLQQGTG